MYSIIYTFLSLGRDIFHPVIGNVHLCLLLTMCLATGNQMNIQLKTLCTIFFIKMHDQETIRPRKPRQIVDIHYSIHTNKLSYTDDNINGSFLRGDVQVTPMTRTLALAG